MGRSKKTFQRNKGLMPLSDSQHAHGLGSEIFKTVHIRHLWRSTVGDALAKVTFVQKVIKGKLFVMVEHGGWAYQLTLLKADILSKLQKNTDIEIKDIQFLQTMDIPKEVSFLKKPATDHKFSRRNGASSQEPESIQNLMARIRTKHIGLKQN